MNTTNFHIGLAIKQLADKKKCSAETLAQRLGIVRQSVYDTYERETVRKSTVKKYASALGVSEDDVYRIAGFKPDNSKVNTTDSHIEGDSYMMRRLADLEEMVQFLKGQVSEKDKQISVLLGKSGSVSSAGYGVGASFFGAIGLIFGYATLS